MNDWIATDLDGTLFSRRWGVEGAVPATWRVDPEGGYGIPSSWMPGATHRAMLILQRGATLVPVTARDADSFSRVAVEGLSLAGPAVIANGALILDRNGTPDPRWEAEVTLRLSPWQDWIHEALIRLVDLTNGLARPRLVAGPKGLSAYLVAKALAGWWQSEIGEEIRHTFDWNGCNVSLLGDELQVLPPGIGKAEALCEVKDWFFDGESPLICFGDMTGDLDFMRLGGLLATPRYSVLDEAWAI